MSQYSTADAIIMCALAAVAIAYLYFKSAERKRKMELVHHERMAAMEKGIPIPEFPYDPPRVPRPPNARAPLLHGIVWIALGVGGMAALMIMPGAGGSSIWPVPFPLVLVGVGLIIYYLVSRRQS